jgi:hypothetical protein
VEKYRAIPILPRQLPKSSVVPDRRVFALLSYCEIDERWAMDQFFEIEIKERRAAVEKRE